jgi:hypothetical protein
MPNYWNGIWTSFGRSANTLATTARTEQLCLGPSSLQAARTAAQVVCITDEHYRARRIFSVNASDR